MVVDNIQTFGTVFKGIVLREEHARGEGAVCAVKGFDRDALRGAEAEHYALFAYLLVREHFVRGGPAAQGFGVPTADFGSTVDGQRVRAGAEADVGPAGPVGRVVHGLPPGARPVRDFVMAVTGFAQPVANQLVLRSALLVRKLFVLAVLNIFCEQRTLFDRKLVG